MFESVLVYLNSSSPSSPYTEYSLQGVERAFVRYGALGRNSETQAGPETNRGRGGKAEIVTIEYLKWGSKLGKVLLLQKLNQVILNTTLSLSCDNLSNG